MGRRLWLSPEDLQVVADTIELRIAAEMEGKTGVMPEDVQSLAPLFRVRERVLSLRGKAQGASKPAGAGNGRRKPSVRPTAPQNENPQ